MWTTYWPTIMPCHQVHKLFPTFTLLLATTIWLHSRFFWNIDMPAQVSPHYSYIMQYIQDNRQVLDLKLGMLYASTIQSRLSGKNVKTLVLLFIAMVLLSNAWDTELNPGPTSRSYVYKGKYPCQICRAATKWGQQALACEGCQGWYHRECIEMKTSDYVNFRDSSIVWICNRCDLPNHTNTLTAM